MASNMMQSINPHNGQLIKEYKKDNSGSISRKLQSAEEAFKSWRKLSAEKRARYMFDVAQVLEKNKQKYAELMTLEVGKPILQSIAEVEKCIWLCHYYLEHGAKFLKSKKIETDAALSYVSYEPLGPVLAVMPWNYPFWQVFRFAIPNLIAGNVGILKHASSVPGCALAIEEIFAEAGLPEHTFQTLLIGSDLVEEVIENPIVKAVTLTGSKGAGEAVASIAGANIKKTVLELGGNNAVIVCKDANLDKYMPTIAWSRYQNTGQSCIAGKRFFVHTDIYDDFMKRFRKEVEAYKTGEPMRKDVKVGPLSSEKQAKIVEEQVQESVEKGAVLSVGGKRKGAYYEPSILENVTPGMPAFDDEIFGPVAAITRVKSIEEAIEHSNNSIYGLGMSFYTEDTEGIQQYFPLIEDGAVFVNELVKSDPRLPFGGTKNSGYGRELAEDGILEFVNRKTVYIAR